MLVTPPTKPPISAEDIVKQQVASDQYAVLDSHSNISILKNPIPEFNEDEGRHPSPEQTVEILHCIDAKVKELFGAPYILPSATDEILVTKKNMLGSHRFTSTVVGPAMTSLAISGFLCVTHAKNL